MMFLYDTQNLCLFSNRTAYEKIEHAAKGNQINNANTALVAVKQDIIKFFAYAKAYIHRYSKPYWLFIQCICFTSMSIVM